MSRSWIRSVRCILMVAAAFAGADSSLAAELPSTASSSVSPFEELRSDPFAGASQTTETKVGKLIDLTGVGEKPVSLSDGARYIDTALVGRNGRLLGLFARSDYAFSDFISPASNPLFFEDPRTLTEVRLHYINQSIPNSNPVFQGGKAQYLAAQIRVALTQRLSIIATKDGYIWLNPDNPAVADSQGFADVAAGLKYNVYRNAATQTIWSVGGTVEMDVGAHQVFQGRGDGEFHLFSSGGQAFFGGLAHWVSGSGVRLPTDTEARSSMWYWSNQWDVKLTDRLYCLGGVNWFHWFEAGSALAANFEGQDLFNLGASGVRGNDVVTGSLGLRYRFGRMNEAGICWMHPLTDRRDLLASRLFLDLCIRY